jgi:hypothetical protein
MANLNDKELRELFRQKFDDYNVALPDDDWEMLQTQWARNQKRRRRFVWYWIAAASMVGILLSGLGYKLLQPSEQQLPTIAQTSISNQNNQKATAISSASSASSVSKKRAPIALIFNQHNPSNEEANASINTTDSLPSTQSEEKASIALNAINNIASTTTNPIDTLVIASSSSVYDTTSDYKQNKNVGAIKQYETLPQPTSLIDNSQDQNKKKAKSQPISWLAVHVQGNNGLPNGINTSNAWLQPSTLDYRLFTQVNQSTSPSATSSTQMITFIDKKTYAFPISWGLSFSIPISRRWEIQTGGMYTQLVTTGEVTSTVSSRATGRIEQNYVGIPFNIAYLFLVQPSFSVYGTAGGSVEKGVSLVEKIYSYNAQNVAKVSDQYSTTIHGFQYSLDGNIGASYRVYKFIFGYFETGVAYYIPSNQPESYRTAHPFGITVKAGIRFTFGKE